jgi:L-rhamnose-H+ transport protein
MAANPALGVLYHWLGGLASGSFYVPYRGVKRWSWETYWLVGGVFSWIAAPWLLAFFLTKDLGAVLAEAPGSAIFWAFFFGLLWGVGGLTFGLTMRYLGLSLGMAVVMGLCAAFGTLMPPIFRGVFVTQVLGAASGRVILLGIGFCLIGIAIAGLAGVIKERSMPPAAQLAAIKEFNLKKGLIVAALSGVMSACFAYGLAAGDPIKQLTLHHGTPTLWQGLPVLVVVLLGGFATNLVWTVSLNVRNRTGRQYFSARCEVATAQPSPHNTEEIAFTGPTAGVLTAAASTLIRETVRVPLFSNYLLCAIAGVTWYMQFFFYTMGETQMGAYKFSSWTIHMASIIIFSTLWGIGLNEWKGAGKPATRLLALGLAVLVGSTVIIGYGNYLGAVGSH